MPNPIVIGGVVDLLSKGIDRIFPDKVERDKAKHALIQAEMDGQLRELEISMSAIIAEANSSDPWTSRARPTFMYVIYILLLASLPMGVLSAFSPEASKAIIEGYKGWLGAIPSDMWWLFGAGFLGYTGARTYEKKKGVAG